MSVDMKKSSDSLQPDQRSQILTTLDLACTSCLWLHTHLSSHSMTMTTEADTCRVVLWAHPGGERHEILIDCRPMLQERWLKALQGCLGNTQGRHCNICQPPHMSWGRLVCSNLAAPEATAVLKGSLIDIILCLRPTVGGSFVFFFKF